MDCTLIHEDLIGYHFATLSDAERQRVEAHLVACSACLRSYLTLKAHLDRGGDGEAPSEAARLRLRAAVESRFRPTSTRRIGRWLTRPVPFYQGLAVAAFLAIVAALGPSIARAVHPSVTPHVAERVDTARPSPQSLTLY
jgi:anti-sigma factor RsiW